MTNHQTIVSQSRPHGKAKAAARLRRKEREKENVVFMKYSVN
jgi:hypothetical protein